MAELSPIMQDSMKEEEDIVLYRYEAKTSEWGTYLLSIFGTNEWGNYLHSYSVASAGPSSEEDSMEHMELETRGIEMDSSNPSYKRYRKNACLSLNLMDQKSDINGQSPNAHPISFTRCHLCVRIFSTKANLSSHIRFGNTPGIEQ